MPFYESQERRKKIRIKRTNLKFLKDGEFQDDPEPEYVDPDAPMKLNKKTGFKLATLIHDIKNKTKEKKVQELAAKRQNSSVSNSTSSASTIPGKKVLGFAALMRRAAELKKFQEEERQRKEEYERNRPVTLEDLFRKYSDDEDAGVSEDESSRGSSALSYHEYEYKMPYKSERFINFYKSHKPEKPKGDKLPKLRKTKILQSAGKDKYPKMKIVEGLKLPQTETDDKSDELHNITMQDCEHDADSDVGSEVDPFDFGYKQIRDKSKDHEPLPTCRYYLHEYDLNEMEVERQEEFFGEKSDGRGTVVIKLDRTYDEQRVRYKSPDPNIEAWDSHKVCRDTIKDKMKDVVIDSTEYSLEYKKEKSKALQQSKPGLHPLVKELQADYEKRKTNWDKRRDLVYDVMRSFVGERKPVTFHMGDQVKEDVKLEGTKDDLIGAFSIVGADYPSPALKRDLKSRSVDKHPNDLFLFDDEELEKFDKQYSS